MKKLKSYAWITLGCVVFSLSFDWFFAPNGVAMGGITGLAQVLHALIPPLSVGVACILLNVPLFLAGWKFLGFHVLAVSLYAMAASSLAIDGIAAVYAFEPVNPMLASLCGGVLMGLGLGIVFAQGATTGGTDTLARLIGLKFPWLPMGKLVLIPDFVVLTLAGLVFKSLETTLYGLVALFVASRVMDTVLYGLDRSKVAYVISDEWQKIADVLLRRQDRGVTILRGQGAYTARDKQVLMIAFKQKEIVQIKKAVHALDPQAFMIVCNAHEVLGEGFREYQKEET